MIPLSLQLVKQDVQPEGWLKTAYILNLTCSHSLVEIQRYAQIPPGQALLLPPPDSEAPDDLFPEELAKSSDINQAPADSAGNLLDVWARAKSKIWHFEIQDSQIANWFEKNFGLTVCLKDFDSPVPPARFTIEILTFFLESIDRHAGR